MSRAPNTLIFVYECRYCHEKVKCVRSDIRQITGFEENQYPSFRFSICPNCKSVIRYRDERILNQSYTEPFDAKLLECRSVSFQKIPDEFSSIPDLIPEAPINILRLKQFQRDAELAVRMDVWWKHVNKMIWSQYSGNFVIKSKGK
jgi:hypothetical protein